MIASIMQLLFSKDDTNVELGAQLAFGQGVAMQIFEHIRRELKSRYAAIAGENKNFNITAHRESNIGKLNNAIGALLKVLALNSRIFHNY
jgi:hypothetical protein